MKTNNQQIIENYRKCYENSAQAFALVEITSDGNDFQLVYTNAAMNTIDDFNEGFFQGWHAAHLAESVTKDWLNRLRQIIQDKTSQTLILRGISDNQDYQIYGYAIQGDMVGLMFTKLSNITTQNTDTDQQIRAMFAGTIDFLRNTPSGIFAISAADLKFEFVSHNFLELIGLNEQDLKNKFDNNFANLAQHYHVDSLIHLLKSDHDDVINHEFTVIGKGDYERWFHFSANPVIINDRKIYNAVLIDISDSVKKREEFINENAKLEDTINNIPVGLMIYRKTGDDIKVIGVNDYISVAVGSDSESLFETDFQELLKRIYPEDRDLVNENLKKMFIPNNVNEYNYRSFNAFTNSYSWLNCSSLAVEGNDHSITCYAVYKNIDWQKQIERQLSSNEERLKLAFSGTGITVFEYDVRKDSMLLIKGAENDESLVYEHDSISQLQKSLDKEETEKLNQLVKDIKSGKINNNYEITYHKSEDETATIRINVKLTFDKDNKPLKAYGIVKDITDFKMQRANFERQIREISQIDPHTLGNFRLDLTDNKVLSGESTSVNLSDSIEKITVDEWINNCLATIGNRADRMQCSFAITRTGLINTYLNGENTVDITFRRFNAGGGLRWTRSYFRLIKNPNNEHIETIVLTSDIDDEFKETQIVNRITNEHFDYLALIDTETRQIKFHNISGYALRVVPNSSESYDKDLKKAMHDIGDESEFQHNYEALKFETLLRELRSSRNYSWVFTIHDDKNNTYRKQLTFTYLDDTKQQILVMAYDITNIFLKEQDANRKLQKALDEAKKANEMKLDFLANISHDMRTPLNGVLGYLKLADESENIQEIKSYLKKINASSGILKVLVDETLKFNSLKSGHYELKEEITNLYDLLNDMITALKPEAQRKSIIFNYDIREFKDVIVETDISRLTSVITKLLTNAIRFTETGNTIGFVGKITSQHGNKLAVQFIISNEGRGIDPKLLPRLFEPFFKAEPSSNPTSASGLGLPIVKQMVNQFGGDIHVSSELNKMTTFTVNLILKKANNQNDKADVKNLFFNNKRILLCEDNFMNSEIAVNLLKKRGFEVDTCLDGKAGLDCFTKSAVDYYDAILSDIRMPVMDGKKMTRAIRELPRADAKTIPIVAMSADVYESDVQACLDAGMNAHIAKPFEINALVEVLKDYLK